MQIVILNEEDPISLVRSNVFNHSWELASFDKFYFLSCYYVDYCIIVGEVADKESVLVKKEDLFDLWDVKVKTKTVIELLSLLHNAGSLIDITFSIGSLKL